MTVKNATVNMMKGMGIGMAVGGAAALVGTSMMSSGMKKQTKKNAMKAMKVVEGFLDDVQDRLK